MKQYVCEGCSHPCTIIVHEGAFTPRWCPYDETRGEMSRCKWVEVDGCMFASPEKTDAHKDPVDAREAEDDVVHKTGDERVLAVEGMTPEQ